MLHKIKKVSSAVMLITAMSLFSGCQSDGNLYGYNFQSAKITYTISGSSQGTSTVLIKGEKKLIKNSISMTRPDGTTVIDNSLIIQNGEKQYNLDSKAKTGSLIKNPFYSELKSLSPDQRKQRLIEEAIRYSGKDHPKSEKQDTIAGQKCDLYSEGITTTCLWQGIPLQTVTTLADYGIQTTTLATKIELNQSISDSEFDIPNDYQITELK